MSVFFVIPSKRPPEEVRRCLIQWRRQGYCCIIQRDPGEAALELAEMARVIERPYLGYAEAVNHLARIALDRGAEWIVTGGDDIFPDTDRCADQIAAECTRYFDDIDIAPHELFGVMQPTGDRWGESPDQHEFIARPRQPDVCVCGRGRDCDQHLMGAYSDRVASSPWMGAEFCRRINGGRGPLWPEYFHMGEDEELQAVAIKYGVFWQRPDITQRHEHWARPKHGGRMADESDRPAFLERANSGAEWRKYKELFERRKAAGFPGSEPML